ncbi:MAG: hypothetical protein WCY00_02645 [Candidatus Dojkabacteria bacterium]|jgi:hypothetical protein
MPNLDGTGPIGQGPRTGRRGNMPRPRGLGGTSVCTCPSCGHKQPHQRGAPCSTIQCPKCKTPLTGDYC